jgi:hypothetical protein
MNSDWDPNCRSSTLFNLNYDSINPFFIRNLTFKVLLWTILRNLTAIYFNARLFRNTFPK